MSAHKTKLLVSVRNLEEALLAAAAGVDIVDLKEPSAGALGGADVETWQAVAAALGGQTMLSAACGELRELAVAPGTRATTLARQLPRVMRYAKLGLAGCADHPEWRTTWLSVQRELSDGTDLVAVAYADHARAESPAPAAVAAWAIEARAPVMLVDTYAKAGGSLLDWLSVAELKALLKKLREAGIQSVLAGSLSEQHLPTVFALAPDYIGVRGAVCDGARTNALDPAKLARMVELFRPARAC